MSNVKNEKFDLDGIFQIIKAIKDSEENKSFQLSNIKATLWINFGIGGRVVDSVITNKDELAEVMLLKVLTYLKQFIPSK